jgi:hypothetical protein
MAWYIDENHNVYRYEIASPTSIRLDNGRVIFENGDSCYGNRIWSTNPRENPYLKKIDDKWFYKGKEVGDK